jgi:hypothetical protein
MPYHRSEQWCLAFIWVSLTSWSQRSSTNQAKSVSEAEGWELESCCSCRLSCEELRDDCLCPHRLLTRARLVCRQRSWGTVGLKVDGEHSLSKELPSLLFWVCLWTSRGRRSHSVSDPVADECSSRDTQKRGHVAGEPRTSAVLWLCKRLSWHSGVSVKVARMFLRKLYCEEPEWMPSSPNGICWQEQGLGWW